MNPLEEKLTELAEKIAENNRWRQQRCFNLIPSENTPSLFVKLCEISDPSGRYAEHKTALKREIESLAGTGRVVSMACNIGRFGERREMSMTQGRASDGKGRGTTPGAGPRQLRPAEACC